MLGMNMLQAITGARLPAKEPETPVGHKPVETVAVANTTDPRLIKLLKLVEQARTDLLRQGLYRTNAAVCAMHAAAAVPDPMKRFYQALEFQWECLARHAEREGPQQ